MRDHYFLAKHYVWPSPAVHLWFGVMFIASVLCLGVFSWFIVVQKQVMSLMPWLFPFMVASTSISIVFLLIMGYFMGTFQLMPDFMILGSVILFALWLTGLIETGIQMFSSAPNVNSNCINFVYHREYKGPSALTLAWLEQVTICNCWRAMFSFELIACVLICFMFCLALNVRNHRRVVA